MYLNEHLVRFRKLGAFGNVPTKLTFNFCFNFYVRPLKPKLNFNVLRHTDFPVPSSKY